VLFLPAGEPYRKATRAVSPAHHRLAMTRLAIESNPHFALDDREVIRAGPSYTIDTLEELRAEGYTNLVLILGADAIADMPHWKQPERIADLATIAIAPKSENVPGVSLPPNATFVNMPLVPISSTVIRTRAAANQPIRYLVPDAVDAYIQLHGLYKGPGTSLAT
jgi:nicotinate-nucleotide adenylyltransferase